MRINGTKGAIDMQLLYKLLKQDAGSREGQITVTSTLNIIVNLLVSGVKIAIGILTSSIAILSDGAHNAADAASSVLTIVGTKLSARRPTVKHPFGFGRIEYLTSLVIGGLILYTGVEFLISAVKLIMEPSALSISYMSLVIICVAAVAKYLLGAYTVRVGKKVDSLSLTAVGMESCNDSYISALTLITALVFIFFKLNIDAYAGIITAVIIIKAGLEILGDTISRLLGKAGDKELADMLYREIRSAPFVLNAADMMLHNYGPDAYSGSVNIEVDHKLSMEEVYSFVHELQLRIMHEHNVTMVFGLYAVDYDSDKSRKMRTEIASYVSKHEHVKSYHALFISEKEMRIYCDLVVDYELADWDELREDFGAYMKELYPAYELELVVETEFV